MNKKITHKKKEDILHMKKKITHDKKITHKKKKIYYTWKKKLDKKKNSHM